MADPRFDDEQDIRRLLYAYADAVHHRDADAWGETWADDARWVLGPGREVEGRPAIVGLWSTAMARFVHVVQLYQSNDVTFTDAAHAHGRAYLLELNAVSDGSTKVLAAYYRDAYVRTSAGWRFASRELVPLYAGPPDLTGQFTGVAGPDVSGSRSGE